SVPPTRRSAVIESSAHGRPPVGVPTSKPAPARRPAAAAVRTPAPARKPQAESPHRRLDTSLL
ncbi:MAG: hypothetical protein ACRD4U_05515, partial [Candidatus Acidiferrales bacterium]